MARPSKFDPETHITLARGYAMDGYTLAEMAGSFGVHLSTVCEWQKRYPKFREALKVGKERTDYAVEQALLKKAMGGDTVACIFWLKNRRPDKWRDRPKDEQLGLDDPIRQLLQVITEGRKAAA